MILGVGDVKIVAAQRESLRPRESRFIERAVGRAWFTGANGVDECPVEFGNDDTIMVRVSDEEPISRGVRENLTGKREWQIADFRAFEHELERLFVQFAALAKLVDGPGDRLIDDIVVSFAPLRSNNVTRGIDQNLRGPGAHAVTLPHRKFGIVVNRMFDLVAQNYAPDVFR